MPEQPTRPRTGRFVHALGVLAGATVLTLLCFLVLPFLKQLTQPDRADLDVRQANTTELPPPPRVEEPQQEEKQEQDQPKLEEPLQPLSLDELELALDASFSGTGYGSEITINLQGLLGGRNGADSLFDESQLDQPPRAVYQQPPRLTPAMRKKVPATVYVLFTVDENGRVENPIVKDADDPIFEAPALAAVKLWKFEPGRRGGQAVSFRMRQQMTFK